MVGFTRSGDILRPQTCPLTAWISPVRRKPGPEPSRDSGVMGDQQACGYDPAQADGITEDTLLLLDGIYSSAAVGFAFLDRHFRYVRVNERLASIDGCPVADHSGRTAQEVMPGLWPRVEPSFRWVLRSGESLVNFEVSGETIAAPGTVRHWATSIYAVHSQERTIGLGVLVTDITERKRAEAAALHELMRATIAALAATLVAETVYEHHERFDGSGYPRGLKGDEISMGARVIAAADVLEAMASHRPYRPALGLDAAMRRLEEGRGSRFDPPVVDACLGLFKTAQLKLEL